MSSDCAQPHTRNLYWRSQGRHQRQVRSRAKLPEGRVQTCWDAAYFIGQPGYASRLAGPIIGSDRHANGRLKSASLLLPPRASDPNKIRLSDSVAHRYGVERSYAPFRQPARFGVPLVALGRGETRTWTPASSQSRSGTGPRSKGGLTEGGNKRGHPIHVPSLAIPPR